MRTKRVEESAEITINIPVGHQTYNDCPICGHTWETIPAIPGVIHRTQLCDKCKQETNSSSSPHRI